MRRMRELIEDRKPAHLMRCAKRAQIFKKRLRITGDVDQILKIFYEINHARLQPRARRIDQDVRKIVAENIDPL